MDLSTRKSKSIPEKYDKKYTNIFLRKPNKHFYEKNLIYLKNLYNTGDLVYNFPKDDDSSKEKDVKNQNKKKNDELDKTFCKKTS